MPKDLKIPGRQASCLAKKGGKVGKEARLAEPLKGLNHKRAWVEMRAGGSLYPAHDQHRPQVLRRPRRHRQLRPHPHGRLPGRVRPRQGDRVLGAAARPRRRRALGRAPRRRRRADRHGLRARRRVLAEAARRGRPPSGLACRKSVEATTVNKRCGSGMPAAILAHDAPSCRPWHRRDHRRRWHGEHVQRPLSAGQTPRRGPHRPRHLLRQHVPGRPGGRLCAPAA